MLLSSGEENKEKVLDLALKGNEINKASDLVKDPYVFEFLGLPKEKPMMESDLEKALIDHIEKFLLELCKGFMYVGSQQRATLGNTHYYVDMVFYNKILRPYVLIKLKKSSIEESYNYFCNKAEDVLRLVINILEKQSSPTWRAQHLSI
ncbi:PDDEXK nuclease domain-containing protein [Peptoniphilus catoniae]|uniref:PDDEXK nuclease domain-containing protein n=1 Tax=Peptoniphilus catoniae TaxID=1660341 RepID=UPI001FEA9C2A|nr:PDDEXK nuclease domain-containing protein [Peptoniphilus catoniae]